MHSYEVFPPQKWHPYIVFVTNDHIIIENVLTALTARTISVSSLRHFRENTSILRTIPLSYQPLRYSHTFLTHSAAAAAKSLQSCPTLCIPIDGSPPGSPVPGILQARTLEWVAISFSNTWTWKVKVKSLSRVQLFVIPWIVAHQAFLSITNSRSLFKLMAIESVMLSSHLILSHPLLLLPPIPPSIRVFSNESTLCMRWPKY